ncbi:MAG: RHS repeat protein [Chloroflexi bacterium]|nr:MAG: RHS repeat protein [Chloroflexota bacterium]
MRRVRLSFVWHWTVYLIIVSQLAVYVQPIWAFYTLDMTALHTRQWQDYPGFEPQPVTAWEVIEPGIQPSILPETTIQESIVMPLYQSGDSHYATIQVSVGVEAPANLLGEDTTTTALMDVEVIENDEYPDCIILEFGGIFTGGQVEIYLAGGVPNDLSDTLATVHYSLDTPSCDPTLVSEIGELNDSETIPEWQIVGELPDDDQTRFIIIRAVAASEIGAIRVVSTSEALSEFNPIGETAYYATVQGNSGVANPDNIIGDDLTTYATLSVDDPRDCIIVGFDGTFTGGTVQVYLNNSAITGGGVTNRRSAIIYTGSDLDLASCGNSDYPWGQRVIYDADDNRWAGISQEWRFAGNLPSNELVRYIAIRAWKTQEISAVRIFPASYTPDIDNTGVGEDNCNPCTDSDTAQQTQSYVGRPINPRNGIYTYGVDDISVVGLGGQPLTFRRFYTSDGNLLTPRIRDVFSVDFGWDWSHNFNSRIITAGLACRDQAEECLGTLMHFYMTTTGEIHPILASTSGGFRFAVGFLGDIRYLPLGIRPPGYPSDAPALTWRVILRNQTIHYYDAAGFLRVVDQRHAGISEDGLTDTFWQPTFLDYEVVPFENVPDYIDPELALGITRLYRIRSGQNGLRFGYDPATGSISQITDVTNIQLDPITQAVISEQSIGRQVTYAYRSDDGYLEFVTDVRGETWEYVYQSVQYDLMTVPFTRLSGVINPLGEIVEEQTYCSVGELCFYRSEALPNEGKPLFTGGVYTQRNGVDEVIAQLDYVSDTEVRVTDGNGVTTRYRYHPSGALRDVAIVTCTVSGQIETCDVVETLETTEYDANYRPVTQIDSEGIATHLSWSADGHNLINRTIAGYHWSYAYDTYNQMLESIDPRGLTVNYSYDDVRFPLLPTQVMQPPVDPGVPELRFTTNFVYDANGYLSSMTNPGGQTVYYTYNPQGQREQIITNYTDGIFDPERPEEDRITRFVYDPIGRLIETIQVTESDQVSGLRTVNSYDAVGNLTLTVVNYTGSGGAYGDVCVFNTSAAADTNVCFEMVYDAANRLIQTRDHRGQITRYAYDTDSRPIQIIQNYVDGVHDPSVTDEDIITQYQYDANGNTIVVIEPDNRLTHICYDHRNRPVRYVVNPAGNHSTSCFTSIPAMNTTASDVNVATAFELDGNGNILAQINAEGQVVQRVCYDALNRMTRRVLFPTGNDICSVSHSAFVSGESDINLATDYEYDGNGNLIKETAPDGVITRYAYDGLDRPISVTVNYQDGIHAIGEAPDQDIITNYAYDSLGNLKAVVDPAGRVSWMCYDGLNQLTREVVNYHGSIPFDLSVMPDPATLAIHDQSACFDNPPLDITDPAYNRITHYGYDALGRVVTITNPIGITTRIAYDALGRETAITENYQPGVTPDADTNVTSYLRYNAAGELIEVTNALGVVTRFEYDALGRQTAVIQNAQSGGPIDHQTNVMTTFAYNSMGYLIRQIAPDNQITEWAYDALGRTTTIADHLPGYPHRTTHYTYNKLNEVTRVTNPLGFVTLLNYDNLARQTRAISPQGTIVDYEYDSLGRVTALVEGSVLPDSLTRRTTYAYDAVGRITGVGENVITPFTWNDPASPDRNLLTTYSYDINGNLMTVTLPSGAQVSYGYDALNRRVQTDGVGELGIWQTHYDGLGRPVAVQSPMNQISFAYDDLNRVTGVDYLNDSVQDVGYAYDALGRRLSMTDGSGLTSYSYDLLNRVTQVDHSVTGAVGYRYDASGRRVGLDMPGGRTVNYAYDSLNRLTTVSGWDGNSATYTYDAADRLAGMSLSNGISTQHSYDQDNRLTLSNHYLYNGIIAQNRYAYNTFGMRTQSEERLAGDQPIVIYTQNSLDENVVFSLTLQRLREKQAEAAAAGETYGIEYIFGNFTQEQTNDPQGIRLQIILTTDQSGGASTPIGADWCTIEEQARCIEATFYVENSPEGSLEGLATLRYSHSARMAYDAANNNDLNETEEALVFEAYRIFNAAFGEALSMRFGESVDIDFMTVTEHTVEVNGESLVEGRDTDIPSVSTFAIYEYDGVNRLTRVQMYEEVGTNIQRDYTYTYDLMGNRLTASEEIGGDVTLTTFAYNQANQITSMQQGTDDSVSFTYDPNGNLTSDGVNTYAYDPMDRLSGLSSTSGTFSFGYDGDGNRISQTVGGTQTHYILDTLHPLTQVLGEVQPGSETWYLLGLDTIGQEQDDTWDYFGYDGLGSVRYLTNGIGDLIYSAAYAPYGNYILQEGTATTSLGFTGEYTDKSGLLYLRARYANLSISSFISTDPVQGGVGARSVRWNPYLYAGGNPVNYVDPSGRFFWWMVGGGAALFLGKELLDQVQELRERGVTDFWDIIRCLDAGDLLKETLKGTALGALFGGSLKLTLSVGRPLLSWVTTQTADKVLKLGGIAYEAYELLLKPVVDNSKQELAKLWNLVQQSANGSSKILDIPTQLTQNAPDPDAEFVRMFGYRPPPTHFTIPGGNSGAPDIEIWARCTGPGNCAPFAEEYSSTLRELGIDYQIYKVTAPEPIVRMDGMVLSDQSNPFHFFVRVNDWAFDNFSHRMGPIQINTYLYSLLTESGNKPTIEPVNRVYE